jgi:thiol-disulfide isomerase/thioredoxin
MCIRKGLPSRMMAPAILLLSIGCASVKQPGAQGQGMPVPAAAASEARLPPTLAAATGVTAVASPTPAPSSTLPPALPTEVTVRPPKPAAAIDRSKLSLAPDLASKTWINSPPLTMEALRGKVVVVDFWTFACYNCRNTLPYFKAWDQKYRAQGLVIIGVHTPELFIERDLANVKQAVQDDGLKYPIAVDGDYANWNRYRVWAWPTWFIVDKEGYIRYSHVGEGDYTRSEATIQQLLAE